MIPIMEYYDGDGMLRGVLRRGGESELMDLKMLNREKLRWQGAEGR